MPNGWEAPAPAIQPVLPLRLYVPDLEEIRISPVVARRGTDFCGILQANCPNENNFAIPFVGYLNVLEHGGSGWKKRWVVSIQHLISE